MRGKLASRAAFVKERRQFPARGLRWREDAVLVLAMPTVILLFAAFHFYMLRWGIRAYWREIHVTLGR